MTTHLSEKSRPDVQALVPSPRRRRDDQGTPPPSTHRQSSTLRLLPLTALGVDLLSVCVALSVAGLGRNLFGDLLADSSGVVPHFDLAAPLVALGWLLTIAAAGGYDHQVFGAGPTEYRRVFNSGLTNAALVGIGCYLLAFPLSRSWFLMVFLVGIPLLVAGRFAMRTAVRRARLKGRLRHRVMIVGDPAHIDDVAQVLHRENWLGYDVVGALAPDDAARFTPAGVRIVGDLTRVADHSASLGADIVFFASGSVSSAGGLRQVAWELEHTPTQIVLAPSLTDVSRERVSVRPVGGLPLLHLEKPRSIAAGSSAKRAFDLIGSAMLLVALSPVYLFAAWKIWSHDRGPILFKQERIGRDGTPFRCWKFRTMVTDAEALLASIHAEQGSEHGVFGKIKADPRITRPGQWLRRLSLDELPQLVNVLLGDMSLVGPRPQTEHEVALYDDAMRRRLRVRPGMTGLWQVSGRSDLSIEEAIRLDLYYVDNWSMLQDLSILSRTLGAVAGSRGAY